ncbi:MAG: hypothetical protein DYH14_06110 [Betaproteobacteria bacterium PRO3]|nr:hypothetical protein [Betaproteobacteria bacterium PRO3]
MGSGGPPGADGADSGTDAGGADAGGERGDASCSAALENGGGGAFASRRPAMRPARYANTMPIASAISAINVSPFTGSDAARGTLAQGAL